MDMPDNQADRQPDSSDSARWMTFAELAKVRGISKLSATTLVRRHGWRRQRDNQGHVIALVPLTWTNPDVGGQADDLPDKRADNRPDSQGYIAAFEAALVTVREAHAGEVSALRERAEAAERRADSECQRADSAAEIAGRRRAALLLPKPGLIGRSRPTLASEPTSSSAGSPQCDAGPTC